MRITALRFFTVCVILMSCSCFADDGSSYVTCSATLIEYDGKFPWFEEFPDGDWTDGEAPLAKFEIIAPAEYSGREVSILFKSGDTSDLLENMKNEIGNSYEMELPGSFLKGEYNVLDVLHVRSISKQPVQTNTLRR